MGVWRRSEFGRQIARSDPGCCADFDRALPDWRVEDVVGSAYCIAGYEADPRIGTMVEIDEVRRKLHLRGMQLMVDFIPNHVGFDHPWIAAYPERFVSGSADAVRRNPSAFRVVETASGEARYIACGRDPHFLPWTDVAQLDYSREETRAAVIEELKKVAEHADGARCDMAMLVLSDVFARTWQGFVTSSAASTEFWADARAVLPGFTLLAEVYWGLEWRLQQLGFDFTYDKLLYDRLLHGPAEDVRGHLRADLNFQTRSARFIENHDEPRSRPTFGRRTPAAAVALSTLPGLRFFHDGQFEGRQIRTPVQLAREPEEPVDPTLAAFYERLLAIADTSIFHDGDWALRDVGALDSTSTNLVAWRWKQGHERRIVVVNLGDVVSQGQLAVAADLPSASDGLVFEDLLDSSRYERTRHDLIDRGLYVRLEPGQAHIFRLVPNV